MNKKDLFRVICRQKQTCWGFWSCQQPDIVFTLNGLPAQQPLLTCTDVNDHCYPTWKLLNYQEGISYSWPGAVTTSGGIYITEAQGTSEACCIATNTICGQVYSYDITFVNSQQNNKIVVSEPSQAQKNQMTQFNASVCYPVNGTTWSWNATNGATLVMQTNSSNYGCSALFNFPNNGSSTVFVSVNDGIIINGSASTSVFGFSNGNPNDENSTFLKENVPSQKNKNLNSSYQYVFLNQDLEKPGLPSKVLIEPLIYPNPVKDILKVDGLYDIQEIRLITQQGQILISKIVGNGDINKELSVSEYANGLYLLEIIHTSGLKESEKICINH